MERYKAGDFTSGKMGEIFKTCFQQDSVLINHKQFGDMFLINSDNVRVLCVVDYLAKIGIDGDHWLKSESEKDQLSILNKAYGMNFDNWLDMLFYSANPETEIKTVIN